MSLGGEPVIHVLADLTVYVECVSGAHSGILAFQLLPEDLPKVLCGTLPNDERILVAPVEAQDDSKTSGASCDEGELLPAIASRIRANAPLARRTIVALAVWQLRRAGGYPPGLYELVLTHHPEHVISMNNASRAARDRIGSQVVLSARFYYSRDTSASQRQKI
jgi:hypothetical protein